MPSSAALLIFSVLVLLVFSVLAVLTNESGNASSSLLLGINRQRTTLQSWRDTRSDKELLLKVGDWVLANGGYINEKVKIGQVNNYLTGMVAIQDMDQGEMICKIPKNLILNPFSAGNSISLRGSDRTCKNINFVYDVITKDPNLQSPYEQYLATRTAKHHHHLPHLWSLEGREMLRDLLGQTWHDDGFYSGLENLRKKCWPDKFKNIHEIDDRLMDAIAIADVRYESGNNFIPWYDVINHANGPEWNVDNRRCTDGSFELFTTRKIHAGEQLAMSYDQQSTGYGPNYDSMNYFFGYGFMPDLPQKWNVSKKLNGFSGSLKFTVDYKDRSTGRDHDDSSELKVIFHDGTTPLLVMDDIHKEIGRLTRFALKYKDITDSVPENEKRLIWKLHSSILAALTQIMYELPGISNSTIHSVD